MSVLTLVIDGRDVAGVEAQTILEVARENAITIPTLCYLEGLSPAAACRLCVVEVVGQSKLLAACVTRIEEGMQVLTSSERLVSTRRQVVELLFTERNHVCAVCVANRHCELQDLAVRFGLDHFDLPELHPAATVDASHERYVLDHNRCILCTRCVRVCAEVEGAHALDVRGRGTSARVTSDLGLPWGESTTCTSCGKCVQVCPTGAMFEKGRSTGDARRSRPYLPYLVAQRGRR